MNLAGPAFPFGQGSFSKQELLGSDIRDLLGIETIRLLLGIASRQVESGLVDSIAVDHIRRVLNLLLLGPFGTHALSGVTARVRV